MTFDLGQIATNGYDDPEAFISMLRKDAFYLLCFLLIVYNFNNSNRLWNACVSELTQILTLTTLSSFLTSSSDFQLPDCTLWSPYALLELEKSCAQCWHVIPIYPDWTI